VQPVIEASKPVCANIVLAEDDTDLRAIYAERLRRDGHQVWEACDGAEALELVRAHSPDLLLVDFWMPILNGFEVLEHLANAPEAITLKVVVLTCQGDADTRLEGFALGIRDYWTKDLTLESLCQRVRTVLETTSPTYSSASPEAPSP
jgi:DNA-binding response OmpR family regulator